MTTATRDDDCGNLNRNGGEDEVVVDDDVSIEALSIEMEAPAPLLVNSNNGLARNHRRAVVGFGSVQIRTYNVTLGTRRSGGQERGIIPLTISWDYDEFGQWSVEEFEKQRIPERRHGGEEAFRIDAETGYRVLRAAGFTKHQIRREMFCADASLTNDSNASPTRKIWSKIVSKASGRVHKGDHQEQERRHHWIRRDHSEGRSQF
jgi:hypothetical protein